MTGIVDDLYFKELAEKDPQAVCKRAPCRYDDVKKCYVVSVWGDGYEIFPHGRRIDLLSKTIPKPHEFFHLFIVYYLLKLNGKQAGGEWISEKDLPGGPTFFRGPHEIPTRLISRRFGNDLDAFRSRCVALHGTAIDMGDAAFRFDIVPDIPVAVLYWAGDDEFLPEAKVLYDRSISEKLTPDIVFALAVEVCARIGAE